MKKKGIITGLLSGLLIILLVGIFTYIFRNDLLWKLIHKTEQKFTREYQCQLSIKEARIEGVSTLKMKGITLLPYGKDSLLSIDTLEAKVGILKLLTGNIVLEKIHLQNGFLQLVQNPNGTNYDAFLKTKNTNKPVVKSSFSEKIHQLSNLFFGLIPEDMALQNLELRSYSEKFDMQFKVTQMLLKNQHLVGSMRVITPNDQQEWILKGTASPRQKNANLYFYGKNKNIRLPYLDYKWNLSAQFSVVHIKLQPLETSNAYASIAGIASVKNLEVNHAKIATQKVAFPYASFQFNSKIEQNDVTLDSTSTVQINGLKIHPYFSYKTQNDTIYTAKIKIPLTPAQTAINALPKGLFKNFAGMKASGKIGYNLYFEYPKNKPNQLKFETKFIKDAFKIIQFGAANLAKLNTEFSYSAKENGQSQRAIWVGGSNPNFTPLENISPYLSKCVLVCEDPSFMQHKGFVNQAFKQSIAKNLRAKRFARGASTISMQLVKNVFLTREKTISRKIEEIFLVYLLEQNRISSKERMLEVYLNVIEWAPNVYGIGEAAAFYFNKKPIELTLDECLFLASIVPKPKKFMQQFESTTQLKRYAQNNIKFLKRRLLSRGWISETDTISTPVFISGNAKKWLKPSTTDTVAVDSLQLGIPISDFEKEIDF